jgi:hypothetical protein
LKNWPTVKNLTRETKKIETNILPNVKTFLRGSIFFLVMILGTFKTSLVKKIKKEEKNVFPSKL